MSTALYKNMFNDNNKASNSAKCPVGLEMYQALCLLCLLIQSWFISNALVMQKPLLLFLCVSGETLSYSQTQITKPLTCAADIRPVFSNTILN